jgi:hypothetical protein
MVDLHKKCVVHIDKHSKPPQVRLPAAVAQIAVLVAARCPFKCMVQNSALQQCSSVQELSVLHICETVLAAGRRDAAAGPC